MMEARLKGSADAIHLPEPLTAADMTASRYWGKCSSEEMKLTDEDFDNHGQVAHIVRTALAEAARGDNRLLMELNINKSRAELVFRSLGRKGRCVWLSPYFKEALPYISTSTLVLVPVAHLFLHGLLKDLLCFVFGLWTQQQQKQKRKKNSSIFQAQNGANRVQFTKTELAKVSVCIHL
jgi:hypothetical protein